MHEQIHPQSVIVAVFLLKRIRNARTQPDTVVL